MKKIMLVVSFIGILLANGSWAADVATPSANTLAEQFKSADNNSELSHIAQPLRQLQTNFDTALKSALKEERLRQKMRDQLYEHIRPSEFVPLFFKQIDAVRDPQAKKQKLHDLQMNANSLRALTLDGGVSGRVTVDAAPPAETVSVFVFDSHGYFAGSGDVDPETGEYIVNNLPSDSFYVVARSGAYVDEIYNDVKSPLGSWDSWRQAQKVFVPQAIVGGINFELDHGVKVTGTVTDGTGTPLETATVVDFVVAKADEPAVLATASCQVVNGVYEFVLPSTGRFKIQAQSDGFNAVWYANAQEWADATIVDIAELTDTPTLDFQLSASDTGPTGQISGTVSPAIFAVTAAFDAADTSFVQMGISLGLLFVPYTIPDLAPGDYFVYADDYLGTLLGGGNYRGEFYDGADGTPFVNKAQKVTVLAGEETADINLTLDAGATLKGRVTDSNDAPLDSLSLLIINSDLLSGEGDPFLARFELHIVSTDFSGDYEIPGLRTGSYYLRTFSDYFINFDLANTDSLLLDGKHKGEVIDEYYGGEQNLLNVMNVEPLVIETESEMNGLDFKLAAPNFIVGTVLDAATSKPVTDVLIAALEDSSGFPWFPLAEIDSLGDFKLGPLPQGNYKLVALTGFSGDVPYLSEYFRDQRSFYQANIINLDQPRIDNIDFALETGGVIQGFVDLAAGNGFYPAGGDTLDGMPVVAYDSQSGKVASYDFVQFNGGWRIDRLLPGSYKVQVVPQPTAFAATYLGGGDWFGDAANTVLTLNWGDVTPEQKIELEKANGAISGTVIDSLTGSPLSSVFVGAYDGSGHLAGYALTDIDEISGRQTSADGSYTISGLRNGGYYVRTVALFSALPLVEQATAFVGLFENFDLFGFLLGGDLTGLDLSLPIYKDYWHPMTPATMSIDLDELVFQASAYGLPSGEDNALVPVYLPLPFFETVPGGAEMVSVTQNKASTVNFVLTEGAFSDLSSGVQQQPNSPSEFVVMQNYPNPFNPSTTLTFSTPRDQQVSVRIVDMLGREVATLANGEYTAGVHRLAWNGMDANGRQAAAGLYFARVVAGEQHKTVKMLLVK